MRQDQTSRISRETLLRQLGGIPEAYIVEAADFVWEAKPESAPRRRRSGDWWRRVRTSPAFAVCLGLAVALVVVTAILRVGHSGEDTPAGLLPGTNGTGTAGLPSTEFTLSPVPDEYTPQLGRIIRTAGGIYLFAAEEDGVLQKGDFAVLSDGFGQSGVIPANLYNGDLVRVYGLYVRESYPAQMPVYRVELVERGTLEQVNESALAAIRFLNENGLGWEIETDSGEETYSSREGRILWRGTTCLLVFESSAPSDEGYGISVLSDGFGKTGVIPADLGDGDLVQVQYVYDEYDFVWRTPVASVELIARGTQEDIPADTMARIGRLETDVPQVWVPERWGSLYGLLSIAEDGTYRIVSESEQTGKQTVIACLRVARDIEIDPKLRTGDMVAVYGMYSDTDSGIFLPYLVQKMC